MFYEIAMASGHRENNCFDNLRQIKNHTLAGFFGFMCRKMALSIGKSTTD
jgi:hypothetical protein